MVKGKAFEDHEKQPGVRGVTGKALRWEGPDISEPGGASAVLPESGGEGGLAWGWEGTPFAEMGLF